MIGRGAVAYLGLLWDLDPKNHSYFERYRRDAEAAGARPSDLAEALDQLRAALVAAWEVCGRQAELADRLVPPASMCFTGLARLFTG
jgi:hypothetical protein